MGKVLQRSIKRKSGGTAKAPSKRTAARGATGKTSGKPTLRQLNRLLTRNSEQVLRKAKANSLRLIGREAL